jgi:hypothetical protein
MQFDSGLRVIVDQDQTMSKLQRLSHLAQTDLTQTLDIPKISPSTVAQQVFEGLENNAFEVLVGASTQALKKGLTATLPSYIKY